ncbi:DNA adenine methylase [Eubacteriales bacterium OttesenSCG-928-A19]|nr:DNA adenine methylase [Eubacteriales bacterium OttesenSCG-928-A19]
MKPILKYPGAKWRLAPWIIEHMPPHIGYLEPFFGSGAVLFNKPPSRVETINDLDGAVVRFFKVCREQPDDLARAVALTPWSRQEYLASGFDDAGSLDDVEFARQFMIRCWMGFGARVGAKTGFRFSSGSTPRYGPENPKLWHRLPACIAEVGTRLLDVQIENREATEIIELYDGPDLLIYADPPYVTGTRTLNGDQYRHEMTDTDHEQLLTTLNSCKAMVLLSGYDCELYRDMLTGWHLETTQARAERAAIRTECLWINPAAMEQGAQIRMEV